MTFYQTQRGQECTFIIVVVVILLLDFWIILSRHQHSAQD